MLAEPTEQAFTRDGWLFELKLDGYRLIASKSRGKSMLAHAERQRLHRGLSRRSRAPSTRCRSTRSSSTARSSCLDDAGKPSFARLQQRGTLHDPARDQARRGGAAGHVLRVRLSRLRGFRPAAAAAHGPQRTAARSLPETRRDAPARSHRARGRSDSSRRSSAMGLEGIIAKRADANYRGGRSDQWLKIKAEQTRRLRHRRVHESQRQREPTSARCSSPTWSDGTLVYAGRVGTGFNDALLGELGCDVRVRSMRGKRRRADRPSARTAPRPRSFRKRRRLRGSSRSTCARCGSANGRRTACCGTRRSCSMRYDKDPRECDPPGRATALHRRRDAMRTRVRKEEPPAPREAPPEEKTFTFPT